MEVVSNSTSTPQPSSEDNTYPLSEETSSVNYPLRTTPSSINSILRQHARQRLYIKPLRWTAQHVRLLGCEFVDESYEDWLVRNKDCRKTLEKFDNDPELLKPIIAQLKAASAEDRPHAMRCLLREFGLWRIWEDDFDFKFAERLVCRLINQGIYTDRETAPPALAFFDLGLIAQLRSDKIGKTSRRKRSSKPTLEIISRKQARARPVCERHDPYILAVLIALAQGQRCSIGVPKYVNATPPASPSSLSESEVLDISQPQSTGLKVYHLALSEERLYLYTAIIPLAFLDRLDKPSQEFASETVRIYCCCLPLHSPESVNAVIATLSHSISKGSLCSDDGHIPTTLWRGCQLDIYDYDDDDVKKMAAEGFIELPFN